MAAYASVEKLYKKWQKISLSGEEKKLFQAQLMAIRLALHDRDVERALELVESLHQVSNHSPIHHWYVHYTWGKIAWKKRKIRSMSQQCWLATCAPFASIYRSVKS